MRKQLIAIALMGFSLAAAAQEKAPRRQVERHELRVLEGTPGVRVLGTGPDHVVMYRRQHMMMGRWWKNSELVQKLGINDSQIQQMEQVFQENRLKLIDVRAELERQEARLEPLVEADHPDESQVIAQIDKIAASRAELEKAMAQMSLAVRRVLTLDQWKKLQTLQPAHGPARFEIPLPPPPPPPGGGVPTPAEPDMM